MDRIFVVFDSKSEDRCKGLFSEVEVLAFSGDLEDLYPIKRDTSVTHIIIETLPVNEVAFLDCFVVDIISDAYRMIKVSLLISLIVEGKCEESFSCGSGMKTRFDREFRIVCVDKVFCTCLGFINVLRVARNFIKLDEEKNTAASTELISSESSSVEVYRLKTDEESVVASCVREFLNQ